MFAAREGWLDDYTFRLLKCCWVRYWQTRTVLAEQVVEKRELVDDENDFPADAVTDTSLCVAVTASSGQLKACYLI